MQRVISSFVVAICVLATTSAQGQSSFGSSFGAPNLLAPEQAFSVSQPQADVIEITIADGTYLYDDRTIVQNDAGDILKTERSQPEMYDDPLFGPTPIHKKRLRMTVSNAPDLMVLTYQGCADIGFCYPPQQTELSFSR
ncbi:MAG: protein-disulfide reductase DsbD N-terminal domain-containing protein [Pseudomonadota bacterium]|nr:protein-disulfide reductase DsbD N-terminal domain-containing protein [Pseudomonadota bacterium]MEC9076715.1 protein-disulfide reductase DsbD N-terminal domain-containing protein [Pseudomonadota bacterium]